MRKEGDLTVEALWAGPTLFRSKTFAAHQLDPSAELETTIVDSNDREAIINPSRVGPFRQSRKVEGNFLFRHKGTLYTATGEAIGKAAIAIHVKQDEHNAP